MRPFDPEEWVAPLLEGHRPRARSESSTADRIRGRAVHARLVPGRGRPTRTFEKVKSFMYAEPEAWDALEEGSRRRDGGLSERTGGRRGAGAPGLRLVGRSLSPRDYRARVAPHMRRLFASLPDHVPVIHFGTGTAGILPSMAEAGGDVIGVDWRIDMDRARSAVGGRPVQGNLDPAIAAGPGSARVEEARAILACVAGEPGHVFNLGHGVLPRTPVENLQRLVEVVHEWDPRG